MFALLIHYYYYYYYYIQVYISIMQTVLVVGPACNLILCSFLLKLNEDPWSKYKKDDNNFFKNFFDLTLNTHTHTHTHFF